jgi:hypothetical protein
MQVRAGTSTQSYGNLGLVADVDESTAFRIARGHCRPRGATAIRMAEGLGIGYGRMRRMLAATWEAGQAALAAEPTPAVPASESARR